MDEGVGTFANITGAVKARRDKAVARRSRERKRGEEEQGAGSREGIEQEARKPGGGVRSFLLVSWLPASKILVNGGQRGKRKPLTNLTVSSR
jgi:hypothetical protein